MSKSEITIAIFADYSKAFDTINFNTMIQKMHSFSFSKDFLYWTMNYLTFWQHFVQIDKHFSTLLTTEFGVPQGSILGSILFNLCVVDMSQMTPESECLQYADIQHYAEHAKQVNDMHVSTVLRKISILFRDGQVIQILFLTVRKQKLWSYRLHKCQNITNVKKKKKNVKCNKAKAT